MKTRNFVIVLLLSVLVCVCVLQERGIAENKKKITPAKIAVVDMEKVIMTSKKNEMFEAEFKKHADKAKAELESIREDIAILRDSLKLVPVASDDYAKRGSALMEKEMFLDLKTKFYNQELPMRRQRWIEMAFLAIVKEIDTLAKVQGYDMIIAKEGRKVLFNTDEVDITDEVLEVWNNAVIKP